MNAPIDRSALEASLRPFGESRMLPRTAYVDETVFTWENEHFFDGGWSCVARSEDLASPGDQRAESVGRGGVLLLRAEDGGLRGFANACRHRGHELLACGTGTNRPIVTCPYHAWSYRLDGGLRKAPGFSRVAGFDPACAGLVELPTEEWHGWIFVDPSGTAGPLSLHLDGLEELIAPYEPERLVTAGRHDYVVEANWKVLNENYQECYHCGIIHPEFCRVSPPESGANFATPAVGSWIGGWMELMAGAETMSLDGRSHGTAIRGLDEKGRRSVLYIGVFPNLLISLHPEYIMSHRLTPLSAGRTRIQCTWAFPPEDVERADFDPSFAVDIWDITNRQDWQACESVQRGMSHPRYQAGFIAPTEDAVYRFVTMVARRYLGMASAPQTAAANR
jgi:Rieske 2Fe-2S family protein